MKKLLHKAALLLTTVALVFGVAGNVSAASRIESKEAVSFFSGETLLYVLLFVAVAAVIAAVITAVVRKKKADTEPMPPVIVLSPQASPRKHGATLEAQGTFLGGKHFGIVSHAMIGRSSSADIRVDDPLVSGTHCQVVWENGKLFLMDMCSTNGTMVDSAGKLQPKTQVQLKDGSVFWLGNERLSFRVKIR